MVMTVLVAALGAAQVRRDSHRWDSLSIAFLFVVATLCNQSRPLPSRPSIQVGSAGVFEALTPQIAYTFKNLEIQSHSFDTVFVGVLSISMGCLVTSDSLTRILYQNQKKNPLQSD